MSSAIGVHLSFDEAAHLKLYMQQCTYFSPRSFRLRCVWPSVRPSGVVAASAATTTTAAAVEVAKAVTVRLRRGATACGARDASCESQRCDREEMARGSWAEGGTHANTSTTSQSFGRLVGRSFGRRFGRSFHRSFGRSFGRSGGRSGHIIFHVVFVLARSVRLSVSLCIC